jgi:MFS family permease
MIHNNYESAITSSAELSRTRRIGVLLICCMSLFIVGLDVTVVNVALPTIGRDLRASISGLQWTVDAYTVVLASLLTFAGSTAGDSVNSGLSSATHAGWWVLTACGGVVLLLGLIATTRRADASARRTAAALNPEALVE